MATVIGTYEVPWSGGEEIITIYDYTDKSVAISTSKEFGKAYSQAFSGVGGRYNGNLSFGKGWIFPKSKYGNLGDALNKIKSGEIKPVRDRSVDDTKTFSVLGLPVLQMKTTHTVEDLARRIEILESRIAALENK